MFAKTACCFGFAAFSACDALSVQEKPAVGVKNVDKVAPAEDALPLGKGVTRTTMKNNFNTQYIGDIDIGGQRERAILDTGSFEVLVLSTMCEHKNGITCESENPNGRFYDPLRSPDFKPVPASMVFSFGSGPAEAVAGTVGIEFVTEPVDPNTGKPLTMLARKDRAIEHTAPEQLFWMIKDHAIQVFNLGTFDAIVGIGPGHPPTNQNKTLLMSLGINEFAICNSRAQREGHDNPPGYIYWNTQHAKKDNWPTAPVIGKIHWAVSMTSFGAAGHESADCHRGQGCAAIVDSGTSLIAGPSKALEAIKKQIGPVKMDCSNMHELPNLVFQLGNAQLALPPEAYVMKVKKPSQPKSGPASLWDLVTIEDEKESEHRCTLAFMQMDKSSQHGNVWILGMPFLRYFYTVFDREEKQVMFARADAECSIPHQSGFKAGPKKEQAPKNDMIVLLSEQPERGEGPIDVDAAELVMPPWAQGSGELEI